MADYTSQHGRFRFHGVSALNALVHRYFRSNRFAIPLMMGLAEGHSTCGSGCGLCHAPVEGTVPRCFRRLPSCRP
ncbi:hypothetical protein D9623_15485 [Azospirillum brasilense]|uniref:Uncharacterized protein n=1 Tax=Azospirillum brasilense TaxID=192 RepID=A0A4D8QWD5_AZOBR|nr:hypothetical protein [Azospirillum brasilense]QCO11449.1 hypothetical protein D3868_20935 [Azospirillum brasilense]QEL91560.1 hypothetical protein D9621_15265 [Azospirillum brasilense]QEL97856.1 hypothetical protein D9623_15485 [Azospirillum brasilense]